MSSEKSETADEKHRESKVSETVNERLKLYQRMLRMEQKLCPKAMLANHSYIADPQTGYSIYRFCILCSKMKYTNQQWADAEFGVVENNDSKLPLCRGCCSTWKDSGVSTTELEQFYYWHRQSNFQTWVALANRCLMCLNCNSVGDHNACKAVGLAIISNVDVPQELRPIILMKMSETLESDHQTITDIGTTVHEGITKLIDLFCKETMRFAMQCAQNDSDDSDND